MGKRLGVIGLALLVCGVTVFMLAFLNLCSSRSELLGSKTFAIKSDSSREYGITAIGLSALRSKEVEIIVANGPHDYDSEFGPCGWIMNPFLVRIQGGSPALVHIGQYTTRAPEVTQVIGVPRNWQVLYGVWISNPENYPVVVVVTVVFHYQVINALEQTIIYIGLFYSLIGATIIGIGARALAASHSISS